MTPHEKAVEMLTIAHRATYSAEGIILAVGSPRPQEILDQRREIGEALEWLRGLTPRSVPAEPPKPARRQLVELARAVLAYDEIGESWQEATRRGEVSPSLVEQDELLVPYRRMIDLARQALNSHPTNTTEPGSTLV